MPNSPNRTEDEKREAGQIAYEAWVEREWQFCQLMPWSGISDRAKEDWAHIERASVSAAEAEIARLTERLVATQHEVTDHGMLAVKANQRAEAAEAEIARLTLRDQQLGYRAEAAEAISEALRERVARLEEALKQIAGSRVGDISALRPSAFNRVAEQALRAYPILATEDKGQRVAQLERLITGAVFHFFCCGAGIHVDDECGQLIPAMADLAKAVDFSSDPATDAEIAAVPMSSVAARAAINDGGLNAV